MQQIVDGRHGQEQRADQVGIRGGLSCQVICDRLGEWSKLGREDGGIVEQRPEENALGWTLGLDTPKPRRR
jgi:hypothetical protein